MSVHRTAHAKAVADAQRWLAGENVTTPVIQMAAGVFALSVTTAIFGIAGYIAAVCVLSPGYQLFQAANNTTVMMDVHPD